MQENDNFIFDFREFSKHFYQIFGLSRKNSLI